MGQAEGGRPGGGNLGFDHAARGKHGHRPDVEPGPGRRGGRQGDGLAGLRIAGKRRHQHQRGHGAHQGKNAAKATSHVAATTEEG